MVGENWVLFQRDLGTIYRGGDIARGLNLGVRYFSWSCLHENYIVLGLTSVIMNEQ